MLFVHRVCYLEKHLDRVRASADALDYVFNELEVRRRIHQATQGLQGSGRHKVRMTITREGFVDVVCTPIKPVAQKNNLLCLSPIRVDAENQYFYHKTTNRELYEKEFARANEAGFAEILFLNKDGLLTEASRHNVFVKIDDKIVTPPVKNGLLAGVYRNLLLERCSDILEKEILLSDLEKVSTLYLSNAVQGLKKYRVPSPINFLPLEST